MLLQVWSEVSLLLKLVGYIEVLESSHKLTQHKSEALIQNKEIYPPNLPILALFAISLVLGNETQNVFIRENFKMLVTKFDRI